MIASRTSVEGGRQQALSGIQVQLSDELSLTLYASHQLTATVPPGSGVTEIAWSAGPEEPPPYKPYSGHVFLFASDVTPVVGGTATTTIRGAGPNTPVGKVTIYARPSEASNSTPIGHVDLAFAAVAPNPQHDSSLAQIAETGG